MRILSGIGLHGGADAEVRLSLRSGPSTLAQGGAPVPIGELSVARTDRGVCVVGRDGELCVDLVEHLFSAMAVLHAERGVSVEVVGPELPLLDGACREWLKALLELGVEPAAPRQRVVRFAEYEQEGSRYEFEPCDTTLIEVWVDFGPGLGEQRARYSGDVEQFLMEIAGARTFGFLSDRERLRRSGRARAVDPTKVLVFGEGGVLAFPSDPPSPDELARHKLLDLCGDVFLHGGLPVGRLFAVRPGHTATHLVFERARRDGVLAPIEATH